MLLISGEGIKWFENEDLAWIMDGNRNNKQD